MPWRRYRGGMGMTWVGYRRPADTARQLLQDPDRVEGLLDSDDGETSLDLDKAWHGVHWLLTGSADETAHPTSDAILGGEPVGEDLGYGPPRLLSPARVAAVAGRLAGVGHDDLQARLDPAAMQEAGVYPDIWDEEGVLESTLEPAVDDLRAFYAAAARAGECVILTIC